MLKDNVVTNPVGWARATVGKKWKYIAMMCAMLIIGLGLMVAHAVNAINQVVSWSILPFLAIMTALILMYLRALRAVVLALDKAQGK